jgi:alpha-L-fucosidase
MNNIRFLIMGLALAWCGSCVEKPGPGVDETGWPPVDPAAVERWRVMRFGMFIHWGPVSLTGNEIGWSRGRQTPVEVYDNLYREFNPTGFNADEWAGLAKAAGMKYVVLTTKHHDGFCLWDTKQTDYNIMHTPFGRDVVKELSEACRRQGIAFGAYYSTCDWHHPDFPVTSPGGKVRRDKSDLDAHTRYLRAQVTELIRNYGPLTTIWFDVPQETGPEHGLPTARLVRSLQPDILINNRVFRMPDHAGAADLQDSVGDYTTPEQRIGKFERDRPWESCLTVSAHNHWAWGGADDGVKTPAACIGMLVRCASGDGNALLNVGPRPDGVIDPAQAGLLREVGAWMSKNGESIYGTRGGPWKPGLDIGSTRKGSTVYLHLLRAGAGTLELPALPRTVVSASLMSGEAIRVEQNGGTLRLEIDPSMIDPMDTIVRLQLDGSAMDIPPIALPSGITATASNIFRKQEDVYGPARAFDGDPKTRWATDAGTRQGWIAADLGRARTIRRVEISEAIGERVRKFEFQARVDGEWKTLFPGSALGRRFVRKLNPPVVAQEFRLNILEATEGPTLSEIELIGE